jgi:hypothetical protein
MSTTNGIKVARNGVEMGEYMPEAIPVLLSSGTLLLSDHYWKPGMSGWLLLSQFQMQQVVPPPVPSPATHPLTPVVPKKGLFGRIAWLVGGLFMPYFFAWRIIFDKAYGFSVGTKVFYALWMSWLFYSTVFLFGSENQFESRLSLAEQGDSEAQLEVAISYQEGKGTEKDFAAAQKWFLKSAEQGNVSAAYWVGFGYIGGSGVERDPVLAVTWLKKAAYGGHAFAMQVLANQYCTGNGIEKDLAEAYALYSLAIAMGANDGLGTVHFASKNLADLEKEMTPADIEKGKRRIGELKSLIQDRKKK